MNHQREETMEGTIKATKIVKRYGNHTGRRFARVLFSDGTTTDVLTREAGSIFDETRAAIVKGMAETWLRENPEAWRPHV